MYTRFALERISDAFLCDTSAWHSRPETVAIPERSIVSRYEGGHGRQLTSMPRPERCKHTQHSETQAINCDAPATMGKMKKK